LTDYPADVGRVSLRASRRFRLIDSYWRRLPVGVACLPRRSGSARLGHGGEIESDIHAPKLPAAHSPVPPRHTRPFDINDHSHCVAIDAQLTELEHRLRTRGSAVRLANGYPMTIERPAEWSRGFPERNFASASLSVIVDQQAGR